MGLVQVVGLEGLLMDTDYLKGRDPLEALESLARNGNPEALEFLRTIRHHADKVGRTPAEELATKAHIRLVVERIYRMIDLDIEGVL